MPSTRIRAIVASATALFYCATGLAAELPASFPNDIPLADYMTVQSVTEVRRDMMVELHAPGKTLEEAQAESSADAVASEKQ